MNIIIILVNIFDQSLWLVFSWFQTISFTLKNKINRTPIFTLPALEASSNESKAYLNGCWVLNEKIYSSKNKRQGWELKENFQIRKRSIISDLIGWMTDAKLLLTTPWDGNRIDSMWRSDWCFVWVRWHMCNVWSNWIWVELDSFW